MNFAEKDTFLLSKDTDFGSDLMEYISDYSEDITDRREDLDMIRGNNICFGSIMLCIKEYLEDEDITLDQIDLGHYSCDSRKSEFIECIRNSFEKYLNGEYNHYAVLSLIESESSAKRSIPSSLDDKIHFASTRAAASQPTSQAKAKEPEPEI